MNRLYRHAGWIGLVTILPQLWLLLGPGLGPTQLRNAGLMLLTNVWIAWVLCLLLDSPTRRLPLLKREWLRPLLPLLLLSTPQALLLAHRFVSERRIGGSERDLCYAISLVGAAAVALLLVFLIHRTRESFAGRFFAITAGLGLLGVLASLLIPVADRPMARAGTPNILIVVFDALRADALSCYGNPFETSPNIDAMASEGLLFDSAFSTASSSVPGHASLLWGREVAEHGAPSNRSDLPAEMPTSLAEQFHDLGYRSFGICQNPLINATAGFAKGFDYYWSWSEQGRGAAPWQEALLALPVVEMILKLADIEPISLRASKHFGTEEPWLGFVQFLYTHDPYIDGSRWVTPERVARIRGMIGDGTFRNTTNYGDDEIAGFIAKYYGSIYYSDHLLQSLLDQMDEQTRSNTVVILTSDHGETLAEHGHEGAGKHFGYHNASLRIPLVVYDPRTPTGRRSSALTGLDKVSDIALALARGDDSPLEELARKETHVMFSAPYLIAVDDSLKVVLHSREIDDGPTVYRWREDPYDESPLIHEALGTVVNLNESMLNAWEKIEPYVRPTTDEDLRPEKLERLKALGYVE